ncbi:MAG: serine acetyltransferase [Verrucomicrobiaceae bacterium]|nr:serine acetyltransferase [Verrucomicrobiaceae bacterium]
MTLMNAETLVRNAEWLWRQVVSETRDLARKEPLLASFYHASLLNHASLGSALSFLLAATLSDRNVPAMLLRQVCSDAYAADPAIVETAAADSLAHYDRDPACHYFSMPLLNFKGFHAVQAYRVAHSLWLQERLALALFLQNRIASVFDVDIHPGAVIGSGLMVDHGTGVVIGETAVIGNNVSMLHSVTLGGSGTANTQRHPRVDDDVLIASGAKLLGPIFIGRGAKIAAGSVVLEDVAAFTTVAGVPAHRVGLAHADGLSLDVNSLAGPLA